MTRLDLYRRDRALRRRRAKSAAPATGARRAGARLAGLGAALLAVVGYLSAGDKLNDLLREWGAEIQSGTVATVVFLPGVRHLILSRVVASNFGGDVCLFRTGALDLDKDGRATDLVAMLAPAEAEYGCGGIHAVSAVVLRNTGWTWAAIENIPPQSSATNFRWRNGYLFGEVFGTDFPAFSVFALEAGRIVEVHSDFGELPELAGIFDRTDRFKLLVSGRNGDVVISFDRVTGRHEVDRIDRRRAEWSALHVLSSADTGGWRETYSFDGEVLNEDEETGLYSQYLDPLSLVFVPDVCDTVHMAPAPAFSGYYRPLPRAQARICCPVDVKEYGYCDPDQEDGDPETLVIEVH